MNHMYSTRNCFRRRLASSSRLTNAEKGMIFMVYAGLVFILAHSAYGALQLDLIASGIDRPVDVGQKSWEEINLQSASSPGGENYGWRIMEGRHCFNPATGCLRTGLRRPILEYSHAAGCSVTGGYRYRGTQIPQLFGIYVYGDFCSGAICGARLTPGSGWTSEILHSSAMRITTFGEDEAGELYVADLPTGSVYRIAGVVP